jgi:MFS family permease
VRECFSEPYYLLCFAALTLAWLSFTTIPVFILYYAQSVHLDLGTYGKLVTLQYAISLAASYGLGWLADRFHPLRVVLVILGLNVIVSLWGGLRAIESHTFAVAMVAEGVLSGAYLTANGTLAQRLYPKARFAQFASANSLVMAFGSFVAALGLGALLDRAHHAYRLTFLASFSLTLAAIAANLLLYRWFVALGGPRNYVAPE